MTFFFSFASLLRPAPVWGEGRDMNGFLKRSASEAWHFYCTVASYLSAWCIITDDECGQKRLKYLFIFFSWYWYWEWKSTDRKNNREAYPVLSSLFHLSSYLLFFLSFLLCPINLDVFRTNYLLSGLIPLRRTIYHQALPPSGSKLLIRIDS